MAQPTHLKKITTRAKSLQKAHPKIKWTDLIKMAAKELRTGTKVGKPAKKKTIAKRATKVVVIAKKPKAKKMATKKAPAHVAGTKRRKRHHVSGVKGHKITHVIWELLGGALGGGLASVVNMRAPGSNIVKAGINTLAGGGVMYMFDNQKHPFIHGLGQGVGTVGTVGVMHGSGMINGIDDMVSGLFSDTTPFREDQRRIPENTAGNRRNDPGLNEGDYMGVITQEEMEKWVSEGLPATGGDDWK